MLFFNEIVRYSIVTFSIGHRRVFLPLRVLSLRRVNPNYTSHGYPAT